MLFKIYTESLHPKSNLAVDLKNGLDLDDEDLGEIEDEPSCLLGQVMGARIEHVERGRFTDPKLTDFFTLPEEDMAGLELSREPIVLADPTAGDLSMLTPYPVSRPWSRSAPNGANRSVPTGAD